MQRFALPGRGLGEIYRAARATSRAATFFLRQRPNVYTLRESLRYIGVQSPNG